MVAVTAIATSKLYQLNFFLRIHNARTATKYFIQCSLFFFHSANSTFGYNIHSIKKKLWKWEMCSTSFGFTFNISFIWMNPSRLLILIALFFLLVVAALVLLLFLVDISGAFLCKFFFDRKRNGSFDKCRHYCTNILFSEIRPTSGNNPNIVQCR